MARERRPPLDLEPLQPPPPGTRAADWPVPSPAVRAALARLLDCYIAPGDEPGRLAREWPRMLVEVAETIEAALRYVRAAQPDLDDPAAEARAVALAIADRIGGEKRYWPRTDAAQALLWDIEVYRAFDGRNARELAAKYQKHGRGSVASVYRAVQRVRNLRRRRPPAR